MEPGRPVVHVSNFRPATAGSSGSISSSFTPSALNRPTTSGQGGGRGRELVPTVSRSAANLYSNDGRGRKGGESHLTVCVHSGSSRNPIQSKGKVSEPKVAGSLPNASTMGTAERSNAAPLSMVEAFKELVDSLESKNGRLTSQGAQPASVAFASLSLTTAGRKAASDERRAAGKASQTSCIESSVPSTVERMGRQPQQRPTGDRGELAESDAPKGRSLSPAQKRRHKAVMAAEAAASEARGRASYEAPRVAMWPHVPGSRVYDGLFPMYTLPSGSGAYIYRRVNAPSGQIFNSRLGVDMFHLTSSGRHIHYVSFITATVHIYTLISPSFLGSILLR